MRARGYCAYPSIRDHWHEQMSRSSGQSEAIPPVFKSSRKLTTHLSTHSSRDERLSQHCLTRNRTRTRGVEAKYASD
ncbi:hypothetical protein TNCV_2838261 [Trichonephila clavipes]|nr:hypothetical protein TNCV_2838261 [Trichonephila clavipes]